MPGRAFRHGLGIDPSAEPVELVEVGVLRAPAGVLRIYFRVATLAQAALLVRRRCALRGAADCLLEVLTSVERAYHRRLWPAYDEAVERGEEAQFVRSRLYVGGKEVPCP